MVGCVSEGYSESTPQLHARLFLASAHGLSGAKDEAFEILESLVEERHRFCQSIGGDPGFDPLRDDPRYNGLLVKMGLEGWHPDAVRKAPAQPG